MSEDVSSAANHRLLATLAVHATWHGAGTCGSTARISVTSSTALFARPTHYE